MQGRLFGNVVLMLHVMVGNEPCVCVIVAEEDLENGVREVQSKPSDGWIFGT